MKKLVIAETGGYLIKSLIVRLFYFLKFIFKKVLTYRNVYDIMYLSNEAIQSSKATF